MDARVYAFLSGYMSKQAELKEQGDDEGRSSKAENAYSAGTESDKAPKPTAMEHIKDGYHNGGIKGAANIAGSELKGLWDSLSDDHKHAVIAAGVAALAGGAGLAAGNAIGKRSKKDDKAK